jgi:hypothetical protein
VDDVASWLDDLVSARKAELMDRYDRMHPGLEGSRRLVLLDNATRRMVLREADEMGLEPSELVLRLLRRHYGLEESGA